MEAEFRIAINTFESMIDSEDNTIIKSLNEKGIDENLAERLVLFIPIAFTRFFWKGEGIRFSDSYIRINNQGKIYEQKDLEKEPVFVFSKEQCYKFDTEKKFILLTKIASRSSEFNVINQALHKGSKLENLIAAPLVFIDKNSSDAAIKTAQDHFVNYFNRFKKS